MTLLASIFLLASMTSADALVTVLNSPSACGKAKYTQAMEIVTKEANEGKPLQSFILGITLPDSPRARKYLEKSRAPIAAMAEQRGNPLAQYLLAVDRQDTDLLRKAARGGNVQALNALGTMALEEAIKAKGISTNVFEKVVKLSFEYFSKAAAQRDPNGFINLGACYLRGFGCNQDLPMAFECFRSAAEAGHPEGMENLSAAYELGHGVKKDPELSLFWRMKAKAIRGDKAAEKWLRERK